MKQASTEPAIQLSSQPASQSERQTGGQPNSRCSRRCPRAQLPQTGGSVGCGRNVDSKRHNLPWKGCVLTGDKRQLWGAAPGAAMADKLKCLLPGNTKGSCKAHKERKAIATSWALAVLACLSCSLAVGLNVIMLMPIILILLMPSVEWAPLSPFFLCPA